MCSSTQPVFTGSLYGSLPRHFGCQRGRDPRSQSIELELHSRTSGVLPLPVKFPLPHRQDSCRELEGELKASYGTFTNTFYIDVVKVAIQNFEVYYKLNSSSI